MTHSRNERRWSAVTAIGGSLAALLILGSCGREAPSAVAPDVAVLSHSVMSDKGNDKEKEKEKDKQFTLTVQLAGNGNGMVKSSPKGIACGGTAKHGDDGKGDDHGENCRESFKSGTKVTLTATGIGGSKFAGWSGDACNGSTIVTCDVTMDGAKNVVATFSKLFTLTVGTAGAGTGTVTLSSSNGTVACGNGCAPLFAPGTVVTLTATAGSGSAFGSWSSNCSIPNTSDPTTCVDTLNSDMSVTVNFITATTYKLSVTVVGEGAVAVANAFADQCYNPDPTSFFACDAAPYGPFSISTSDIQLTAYSPDLNSHFVKWGGDASGCTTPICVVTMGADRAVTATFGPGLTASLARSESGPSLLGGIKGASVTTNLPSTRSAIIEQQR